MADVTSSVQMTYTYYAKEGTPQAQADQWRDQVLLVFCKSVGKWQPSMLTPAEVLLGVQAWLDHHIYEAAKAYDMQVSGVVAEQQKADEYAQKSPFG